MMFNLKRSPLSDLVEIEEAGPYDAEIQFQT